jgi:tRNA dimethylallyltransferase
MSAVTVIFGPTGTGKTNFAIKLAKKLNAEIINCDMAQIYSYGALATGQIQEKDMCGITHHLLAFLDKPVSISVYDLRKEIERVASSILLKGKQVILVGGSSFCVYSLFFAPYSFYDLNKNYINKEVQPANFLLNTKKETQEMVCFAPYFSYCIKFIDISDRKKWIEGIKKRIDCFFNQGLLQEVYDLPLIWREFFITKKFIGYYEILTHVNFQIGISTLDLQSIKEHICLRTVQYAKRQRTFARKIKRDLMPFNIPSLDYDNLDCYYEIT